MAVEGVIVEEYYAAEGALSEMSPDFKINLVDPDYCSAVLKSAIEKDGIEI